MLLGKIFKKIINKINFDLDEYAKKRFKTNKFDDITFNERGIMFIDYKSISYYIDYATILTSKNFIDDFVDYIIEHKSPISKKSSIIGLLKNRKRTLIKQGIIDGLDNDNIADRLYDLIKID